MTKALLTNCEIVCDGCNCIINHSGDVAFVTEMPQVLEEVRVLLADTLELTLDDIVVSYVIQSAA